MTKSRDFRKYFVDRVIDIQQYDNAIPINTIIEAVCREALISFHALHDWYFLFRDTRDYVPSLESRNLRKRARNDLLDLDYNITEEHLAFVKNLLEADASLNDKELSLALYVEFEKSFPPKHIHTALFKQNWTSKVMEHYSSKMNPKLVQFWRLNIASSP